ncbi:MAG: cofactor-independent phosphoglycerate mutase [Eubacteriales bacterium]|jgi:2,3-bisphosphoglycerate-independent phosphoglycerate mutase
MNRPYKYIVLLGDGMSDRPVEALDGQTPLEAALTPTWDVLAQRSTVGIACTTPDSMSPGSDICNLSVMGYDPERYHTGRSPIEAASIGVPMKDTDTTFRTNFVTLGEEEGYENKTMVDYSAGEISTEEAAQLIEALNAAFQDEHFAFFTGTSYRHILRWDAAPAGIPLTPPHDISLQKITDHLPGHPALLDMMRRSYDILREHPVNVERKAKGLNPANSIWFWGQGTKMILPSFQEKTGLKGGAISAVDLVKGIAVSAGMDVFPVEGATGNYETNFLGKAQTAVNKLREGYDFVYIHVEAPDECGHRNQLKEKIYSIQQLDAMTDLICKQLEMDGYPYRLLIAPDHETPLCTMTHGRTPVPFLLYDSENPVAQPAALRLTEACANATGVVVKPGFHIMDLLLNKPS